MGTDMHLHAEVKIDGVWHTYATPDVDRNYRLFTKVAGVRKYGGRESIETIAEPRGLPDDLSVVARHAAEHTGRDGHSHSWLSAEEIVHLAASRDEWDFEANRRAIGTDDIFGWFYGNCYEDWLPYPNDRPKGIEDVRFVFWFDC